MSYQVRHREFGVYQGSFIGMGFWHLMSETPEQGYCEFPTREDAEKYVDFLCSDECSAPLRREDLTVEPFDKEESDRLHVLGAQMIEAERQIRRGDRAMVN